ncbi:helix-turn-helix domain-containing protein [Nostoc flagelliforme FACHB-838]|uniref:Helix-turn-helix domain-containing protein n=1 Tax=Nostoc flagelliforme FACHB-838 TaxID=2692904 RepID=A0ABR8DGJ0_9NOSO|nr:helix-turn-helix domain-containing protein [Nostoc flagelliforme]MBD2528413.1 helix-turn-helix domain-containing protein [Nostoc flagelliforme FACHB-838]
MLKIDFLRWGESAEVLREKALRATHPRSRERFMALYEISGGKSATQVGRETGRNAQTIMEWVHRYNEVGPQTLVYQRSGGHPPLYL